MNNKYIYIIIGCTTLITLTLILSNQYKKYMSNVKRLMNNKIVKTDNINKLDSYIVLK